MGVNGRLGSGGSSAAARRGWQLGVPVISLVFILSDGGPVEWRHDDLGRALSTMVGHAVTVEGVYLCQALQAPDRDLDSLVWIDDRAGPSINRQSQSMITCKRSIR